MPTEENIAFNENVFRWLREGAGDKVDLIHGGHGQCCTEGAIATCQRLEQFDLFWMEEPVPPTSSMDEMAKVAAATTRERGSVFTSRLERRLGPASPYGRVPCVLRTGCCTCFKRAEAWPPWPPVRPRASKSAERCRSREEVKAGLTPSLQAGACTFATPERCIALMSAIQIRNS